MSEVVCDKCGAETVQKTITSKKNGKQYILNECTGGCMNGKYKYSCFAPKGTKQEAPSGVDNTALLEEIKAIVLRINAKLNSNTSAEPKPEDEF